MQAESAAYRVQSHAEETIPPDQQSWSYMAGDEGPPEGCTDAPEWIAAQMTVLKACQRGCDAKFSVLTTPPITPAGIVALLEHAASVTFPDEEGSEGNCTLCYREDIPDAAANFSANDCRRAARVAGGAVMKPAKPKREPKQRRRPTDSPDEDDDRDFNMPDPHELPGVVQTPVVLRLR
jgi:hypothetical protein